MRRELQPSLSSSRWRNSLHAHRPCMNSMAGVFCSKIWPHYLGCPSPPYETSIPSTAGLCTSAPGLPRHRMLRSAFFFCRKRWPACCAWAQALRSHPCFSVAKPHTATAAVPILRTECTSYFLNLPSHDLRQPYVVAAIWRCRRSATINC